MNNLMGKNRKWGIIGAAAAVVVVGGGGVKNYRPCLAYYYSMWIIAYACGGLKKITTVLPKRFWNVYEWRANQPEITNI